MVTVADEELAVSWRSTATDLDDELWMGSAVCVIEAMAGSALELEDATSVTEGSLPDIAETLCEVSWGAVSGSVQGAGAPVQAERERLIAVKPTVLNKMRELKSISIQPRWERMHCCRFLPASPSHHPWAWLQRRGRELELVWMRLLVQQVLHLQSGIPLLAAR